MLVLLDSEKESGTIKSSKCMNKKELEEIKETNAMAEKQNIDIKEVRELVEMMKENDLVELEIVDGDSKVHLKRPQPQQVITQMPMQMPMPMPAAYAQAPASAPAAAAPAAAPATDPNLKQIKSPIVGTFYKAPSPDSDPYVSVGANVGKDSIVCIIEAMKVMNEIKAECSGTIVEICCEDGQAIEYGQVLFKVKA